MIRNSIVVSLFVFFSASDAALAQWPQWGGPRRDFSSDSANLADSWPEGGPKRIWSRPLGAGYSSISAVGDQLFTMYREGQDEVVIALDANTGKTVWDWKYAAPVPELADASFGQGPNSTPLVHDGKVYTFGVGGWLHALDQKTGKKLWAHDLVTEFAAKAPGFGFSSSPIIYKDSLILAVGGTGAGIMAFDRDTGSLHWKKHDFLEFYSSPIIIQVEGKDELVLLTGGEVVGMDPVGGEIEWRFPLGSSESMGIMTPLYASEGVLFVGTAEAGAKGLKLSRNGDRVSVEEIWSAKKIQVHLGTAALSRRLIFAPDGVEGLFLLAAIEAATGKVLWQERGFDRLNVIHTDGKLITLEENGRLTLCVVNSDKLEIRSRTQLFQPLVGDAGPAMDDKPAAPSYVWSAPTLVGQRLFARDNHTIVALDLGIAGRN